MQDIFDLVVIDANLTFLVFSSFSLVQLGAIVVGGFAL